MPPRGENGRFVREEGLNINIHFYNSKILNCFCCYIHMVQNDRKNRNLKFI